MKSYLVYLAGPITGLSPVEATNWREWVEKEFRERSNGRVECLSPMRHDGELFHTTTFKDEADPKILEAQRNITVRDRYDAKRADLVFFNFLGAKTLSGGTFIEAGWADDGVKPMVMVIDENNPNDHAILREVIPIRYYDLSTAIDESLLIMRAY